ncbi:hypothetical protein F5Y09DRAFT_329661 [Xylaria sp. FL1042]|nr:hypothetical protein F5Y09DRAFT_329661 [Xylaria sp. FL1042]
MSITSYPSLTTSWTPASSCLSSTGYWYVVYGPSVAFSNMFGMPSVTDLGRKSSPAGGCVPPSYTLSVPYLTDGGCPPHYFGACSTVTSYGGQLARYIMCCPRASGWNFNCAAAVDPEPAPYGCQATFTSGDTIIGSRTDLIAKTGQAETHTVAGDSGVNAWGIALLSVRFMQRAHSTSSSSPSSKQNSTSTSTSTPISPSSTHSLSTGTAVGIGVGVGLGVLAILGLVIFWLLRRKYKPRQQQPVAPNQQNEDQGTQNMQLDYDPTGLQTASPNMEWKHQQHHYANLAENARLRDKVVKREDIPTQETFELIRQTARVSIGPKSPAELDSRLKMLCHGKYTVI